MDNSIQTPAKHLASSPRLADLVSVRLSPRDDEHAADPEQGEPEFRHHGEGPERSRGGDVEGGAGRSVRIVLDPGVDGGDVGEPELGGGGRDPVNPSTLCVYQGEVGLGMGDGQRKTGEPGARTQICPPFASLGSPDDGEAEGVLEVPLSDAITLSGTEEAEADRRLVRAIERLKRRRSLMFHVKR